MDFQENFLHAVWKYQYFNKKNLQTTQRQSLEIKKIGFHNQHEGPDFLEAHIRIGNLDYYGHIEIHRYASDWMHHAHHQDEKYRPVILHVVFKNDQSISYPDGHQIPTLELDGKIYLDVIQNYQRLLRSKQDILCSEQLQEVAPIIQFSMLEKALVERLEARSSMVLTLLEDTGMDWEETAYRWMFSCFGFKTNAASMLALATSIPLSILQKNRSNAIVIEALLLGQAGLLSGDLPEDDRVKLLKKEYDFYQNKYQLKTELNTYHWKVMGVRPSNYPHRRIAQIAKIISLNPNLFSIILDVSNDLQQFQRVFQIELDAYWQQHNRPGIPSQRNLTGKLSYSTLNLLVINLITPLWFAYGKYLDEEDWKEKCFDLLQQVSVENNTVIRKFASIGWKAENAFDSQGMIGLYRQYCQSRKCLDCKIGQNILRNSTS